MRFFYSLLIIFLFCLLIGSSYFLWQEIGLSKINLFGKSFGTGSYDANFSFPENNESQFYKNMRYKDRTISYWIEPACEAEKEENVIGAFTILSEKTILDFIPIEKNKAEISILCSEIAPEPEEEGHFIAGEGGPSRIVNMSSFSVILTGRIALFRDDDCDTPQVALHEILHALGFNHRRDESSILYPIASCKQTLDDSIVEELNQLYYVNSEPDLLIEQVSANKIGRYLNFNISMANYGLNFIDKASLKILSGGEEVKIFDLGNFSIGISKVFSVSNLEVSRSSDAFSFVIGGDRKELSTENNRVNLVLR
ncbi:MAG: matrixin family metalloprotease [archaeon]|nr:matrixin family metalloprotease [archaeon]